ncbi:hypothetical protein AB205_0014720 [Aquarana catesbeiana]|uniref:Uncharacterized protein n=1 Tax=Aquarana catesbeiana TaxID=8400 RepID=A0A2G9Q0S6_AQUCT|nr:hypothetical protein AB205_0014720 [Aquarana catesbeiana]
MMFMSPGCGTMRDCDFCQTTLKSGNPSLLFLPRFLPYQLRLLMSNLGLPASKKWRSPAGVRKTSARRRLWNVAARRRRGLVSARRRRGLVAARRRRG